MSWALRHRKRLGEFHKKHFGQKCFIIGNGPSLNRMDLSLLKNCFSFGLNKIHLHPDFHRIGIDYHVAVNSLVIEQSFEQFSELPCPSFASYRACSSEIRKSGRFHFLMTRGGPYGFSPTPLEEMSEGGTVTYIALQLAYFMGFAEVYLIGVDHNFTARGDPNEKQVMQGPDPNHFHPDYFSGKEWNLPDLEASEIAYRMAKYYFAHSGRQIFDATIGGKLDVFTKVNYETAAQECRAK